MKFRMIPVLVLAVWMGLGVSAKAQLMVDFGTKPTHADPQVVQEGWEEGIVTNTQHLDHATPFGTVRHWVSIRPQPEDIFAPKWVERNRASLYAGGAANFDHPTLGEIGHVLQDAMKCDKDCALDLNFTGLEAGVYELTTFHHSWFGQDFEDANGPYNWAEFDIEIRFGPPPNPQDPNEGFVIVPGLTNLSASHHGINSLTEPAIFVTRFTSPGPSEFITVGINPIAGTGETIEQPTNGFHLDTAEVGSSVDFNDSGVWDLPDLNLVLFNWQLPAADLPVELCFPECWVNQRPDTVGLDSLNLVLFNWQLPSTSIAAVPEPSTVLCASIGLLGVICLNRWRRG
jgi:hypothetical protein